MSIYDVHIYGIRISLFKPNSYDIGTIKQTPLQDLVFDADNYYRFIFYINIVQIIQPQQIITFC